MNIRGIELLRKLDLPGPKKEIISRDLTQISLDYLYDESTTAAILAFDYTEPIDQNPLLEKNVRNYAVERNDYFQALNELIDKLANKGVSRKNMIFLTNQTYKPNDIAYSGRAGLYKNKEGFGKVVIDVTEGLRKADTDFNPTFIYQCPIVAERIFRSEETHSEIPPQILSTLIKDINRIPGNPYVDFEVWATGGIFYHDLFLTHTWVNNL